jgi:hypothetical protein
VASIPTHGELIASIGQSFLIGAADGRTTEALLVAAPAGIPMDDSYACYQATFVLPPGLDLSQDVYRIASPEGQAWDLLATPTRPEPDGRKTLTIVIHCLLKDLADTPDPDAVS